MGPENPVLPEEARARRTLRRRDKKKRLIAQILPPGLTALHESAAAGHGCSLEPQFHELYQVLGDREAQDRIRERHADLKHCPMLRANPTACTGCPNNPHERADAPVVALAEVLPLIDRARELHALAELGLLARSVHPAELQMMRIVHEDELASRMRLQALLIAEQVGKMFGGSDT